MGMGGTLRGLVSETPFTSKYILSLGYLVLSLATLLTLKCCNPSSFHMPWFRRVENSHRLVFDRKFLLALIMGGVMEFATSLSVMLAFDYALRCNMN
jgi:hypothetical protein